MRYRQLGKTEMTVSEVAFGVWTVSTGWWGKVDKPDAIKLLRDALEAGITFFDTADTYGEGFGEEIMREALGNRRHEILIGTKFGYDISAPRDGHHKERPQCWDTEFVRKACEDSLRRLGTDYIDLWQLHNPRIDTVMNDELFALLGELQHEGKIRHFGTALGPDIGWKDEGDASIAERDVATMQVIYSIIEQQPARSFFDAAQEHNTGLLARVPHASEILTDQFADQKTVEFDSSDHRAHRKQEWLDRAFHKRDLVTFIAGETGRTLAQAAIQFCLAEPSIAAVLPNIVTGDQLREYAAGTEVPPLEADELTELSRLYDEEFAALEEIQPQRTT
ncbi:MAG: aldo/keto reductase [Chloroflexi bacterium]|nr:aldo/keto reductase [Chloroflexota bacterium]MCH7655678.1 aldo/keto reductase [Chloroflexota bacterium]